MAHVCQSREGGGVAITEHAPQELSAWAQLQDRMEKYQHMILTATVHHRADNMKHMVSDAKS